MEGTHVVETEKSLSFRLESYLVQLADINRRWTQWLTSLELATNQQDSKQLIELQPTASSLFGELQQVIADRQQLLDDARRSELPCADLTTLAKCLPAWDKPSMRASLVQSRLQLAHLRRLHVATWVFISQAVHFYADSMQLLMAGDRPHVYTESREQDMGGGRLLDASL